ncbi:hypothetical protein E2C01_016595 [Portunus trituberculatus]|uniref:Uncharacterized protein n=1 Tax=Portunus trituberculatus TaxID=210409 RepID=A0A5B7DPF9_PORTR|nr:hypothetical protein [Portunus trituberculatus]
MHQLLLGLAELGQVEGGDLLSLLDLPLVGLHLLLKLVDKVLHLLVVLLVLLGLEGELLDAPLALPQVLLGVGIVARLFGKVNFKLAYATFQLSHSILDGLLGIHLTFFQSCLEFLEGNIKTLAHLLLVLGVFLFRAQFIGQTGSVHHGLLGLLLGVLGFAQHFIQISLKMRGNYVANETINMVWISPSTFLLDSDMSLHWVPSSLSWSLASARSDSAWRRARSDCSRRERDSSSSPCRAFPRRSAMLYWSRNSEAMRCCSSTFSSISLYSIWSFLKGGLGLFQGSLQLFLLDIETLNTLFNFMVGAATLTNLVNKVLDFIIEVLVFSADGIQLLQVLFISSLDAEDLSRVITAFLLG